MFKDLSKVTRLLLRTYWPGIVIWLAAQAIILTVYRKMTIIDVHGELPVTTASNAAIFVLAGLIALSFTVLIIFLGHLFSSRQRGAWFRQLPVGAAALNIFPLAIVFLYGLSLLLFIPWGAFTNGVSVFCISIPVAVFLTLKNSEQLITGLIKAGAVGVLLIVFWFYGFYDWSNVHPKLAVELLALVMFSAIWLILGLRERKFVLLVSLSLLIVIGSELFRAETSEPRDFSEAVLNHDFNRSEKTWLNFKRVALDSSYWESVEQFDLPSFVRFKSQDFLQKFTSEEKITFIKNIETNRKRWKDAKLPKYRPLRFASFPQPELRFANYSAFPIGKWNIDEATEKYIYSNWVSSRLYCQILPVRPDNAYLAKVFLDPDCYPDLFNQASWTYSLFESTDYTALLDKYLLGAFKDSPSKTRSMMMLYVKSMWGLDELGEKYDRDRYELFSQTPLTQEKLNEIKADRFRKSLKYLKDLPAGRESFLKELDRASSFATDSKFPVLFICQYVFTDCNDLLNKKKSADLSLTAAWQQRLLGLSLDDTSLWMYWIGEELRKEENWPRVEKLVAYAKSRSDL